jgi:translation initiation factor 2 gamma subunit (eIF-2gamma)
VKNQEQASFLLANQTPAFGIIESPVEPISINKPGLLISLVKGGIIGGILAGIILFGIKLYLDAMNEK